MSSTEYAELAGLTIALSNLRIEYLENQDEDFLLDHLKYHEVDYDLNLNNSFFYNSEEEYDEDETFVDNSIDDDSVS